MSWKTDLKLADLDPHTEIECTCRSCRHVHYEDSNDLMSQGFEHLYLDEVEGRLRCARRQCHGLVRITLVHDDTEGFVGGLAWCRLCGPYWHALLAVTAWRRCAGRPDDLDTAGHRCGARSAASRAGRT